MRNHSSHQGPSLSRKATILAAAAIMGAALLGCGHQKAGVELTYRLILAKDYAGDRANALRQTGLVLQARLNQYGEGKADVLVLPGESIRVFLPPTCLKDLDNIKKLLGTQGRLELRAAATREVQEQFKKDSKIPEGFLVFTHDQQVGEEYAVFKERILLQKVSAIEGGHITVAAASQHLTPSQGFQWAVNFELDREGATRFDETAKVLFNQTPHGLLAIILDDKMMSLPEVNAERFGGAGVLEGRFDEKEARRLAIILRSGGLPAPIGCYDPEGRPLIGEPEFVRLVGPEK